jgi:predicted dehydrogenase
VLPLRVGVVGCGMIAKRYVEGSVAFDTWRPTACADVDAGIAEAFARTYGLRPSSVQDLLADSEIDLVLNLTPPTVHAPLIGDALAAGKHVYTEKTLASSVADGRVLVAEAARQGVRLGCAPDTFLGSAYETGRMLIEDGAIGRPLGASALVLVGGPEEWHPNGDMFFKIGSGPVLDMAPYYLAALVSLLGPVVSVTGLAAMPTTERTLAVGPRAGTSFSVEVPTHAAAVLRLGSGALATLAVSLEATCQYVSGLQVFGSDATLYLPDANAFGGEVSVRRGSPDQMGRRSVEAKAVPYQSFGARDTRGIGLDELVQSMLAGQPHRASGDFGLHVLEAAEAIVRSAEEGRTIELGWGSTGRPPGSQPEAGELLRG